MKFMIMRTNEKIPSNMEPVRQFLTICLKGANEQFDKQWRKLLNRFRTMEAGELAEFEVKLVRSGPFHRRHMKIEQTVFDAQERFSDFEQFRIWLKIGAGWVDWIAGPHGAVVPLPRSVSYTKADDMQFREFHDKVIVFLHGPDAAPRLWTHMTHDKAHEMMRSILQRFDE